MTEDLLKSLNGAIDTAIRELANIDALSKGDMNLQDAKLRPESANGSLPGDNREESALKPEDAKKAESADKGDLTITHKDDDDDKASKAENPFADKDDDKSKDKSKGKSKDKDDDDDDIDDEEAEKMKAALKKYEEDKVAKAATSMRTSDHGMTKSDIDAFSTSLQKTVTTKVEEMHKSFGERLGVLEGLLQKLIGAPQPRQSMSGLTPLAKSSEDIQAADSTVMQKGEMLHKLEALQKSGDRRVDSTVIARVEMNDYSVLAERGINLK